MASDYTNEYEMDQVTPLGLGYVPQGHDWSGSPLPAQMGKAWGVGGETLVLGKRPKKKTTQPQQNPQANATGALPVPNQSGLPPGAGWRAKSPNDPDAAGYGSYQFYNPQTGSYGHGYMNPNTHQKDYMFSSPKDWAAIGIGGGQPSGGTQRTGRGGGGRTAPAPSGPPALAPPASPTGGGTYTDTFSYTRPQNPWETPEGMKYRENLANMISHLMGSLDITPSMGMRSSEKRLYAQTIPARVAAIHQLAQLLGGSITNQGEFNQNATKNMSDAALKNFGDVAGDRYNMGRNQNDAMKNAIELEQLRNVLEPVGRAQASHLYMTGGAAQTSAEAAMIAAKNKDAYENSYWKSYFGLGGGNKTTPFDQNRAKVAAEYANNPDVLSQSLNNYDNAMAGKTYTPPTSGGLFRKGTPGGWGNAQPPSPNARYNPQDGLWYRP